MSGMLRRGASEWPKIWDLRNVDPMPDGLDQNWIVGRTYSKSADGITYGPDPGTSFGPQLRIPSMAGVEGHVYTIREKTTYPYGRNYYFGLDRKYYISLWETGCFVKRDGVTYNNVIVDGPRANNAWYDIEFRIIKGGAFEVRWAASPTVFGVTLPGTAQWTWTDPSQLNLAVADFGYMSPGKAVSTDSGYYQTISDVQIELLT